MRYSKHEFGKKKELDKASGGVFYKIDYFIKNRGQKGINMGQGITCSKNILKVIEMEVQGEEICHLFLDALIDADTPPPPHLFLCNFSLSCRERLIALAELSFESEEKWPFVGLFIPRSVFTSASALQCRPLFRAISTRCILNEKSRLPLTQSE